MNLQHVRVRIHFERDAPPCHADGTSPVAEMHPNWEYSAATIVVYTASMAELDDDDIATVLIHELVHYFLHPISRFGENNRDYDTLEEKVCTDLALAIRSAIAAAGEEVASHYRTEIKRLERELKKLKGHAA